MKIAIICDDFPSEGRPVYVFVEQLANELARQNVEIAIIAPQSLTRHFVRHVPLMPKKVVVENGNHPYVVYRPYSLSLGNSSGWIVKQLEKIRFCGIKKCLKDFGNDLDAIYGHFWHNAYVAREYAYQNNIPMFVACGEGDNAIEHLVDRMTDDEKDKFVGAVKGVISVSTENKRQCINFGLANANNIVVLPNSVDQHLFTNNSNNNIRKKLGVTDNDFLIAFVGSFIHRKGSDRLSYAIDKLNDSHIKTIFIGGSLDGDDATPTCAGIVHMGKLNHNDVPQYLYAADAFCLPTLKEGCSNAIVEALAAGLPVISSDLPFNEDILNETNSIKIAPMNIDQIANAIRLLKDDKTLRTRLSQGALQMASDLRIDKRASAIIEFIRKQIKYTEDN